ncbi:hypothetical protein D9611_005149 [Ephemerocybe angulata]|uniref:ABC transporter domain-containing protein n=1 Tax=Ephemerocybe angulata TaxID=980116 RepID=A0A8H5FD04_9AGAR|nr:hypothetical protein D9611_005149 [Tulosesus angulatus]
MAPLFWIQLRALIWKNWIGLWKRPFMTILRCFLAPVIFAAFLAWAQLFLNKLNNYGIGQPVPVHALNEQFDPSLSIFWSDDTNGSSKPTPQEIMARVTASFSEAQLQAVKTAPSASEIPRLCPQNFNLFSQCFAAISFFDTPSEGSAPINYTLYADSGLMYVNVEKHTSDFEKRIMPLQWAIDSAIIELQTGVQVPTPREWAFTQETNEEQKTDIRLSYVRGLRELLVLAFFITFVGVTYQLPGSVAGERASLVTAHMKAMGLLDKARILSWHLSISLTYLPAWIIVGLLWANRVFSEANVGLIVVVHLIFGLTLASWSFFITAPFGKSPQLAAVVTTFLAIIIAVVALVWDRAKNGPAFIFTIIFPPAYYIFVIRAICGYENHLMPTNVLKGDPDNGVTVLPQLIAGIINIFLWPWLAALYERHLYDAKSNSSKPWYLFWKKSAPSAVQPPADDVAISVRHLNKVYRTSRWSSKGNVTAVNDLSFDVPKTGIFVLLGSNGAGKSTSLSIIAGLDAPTGGDIVFDGGHTRAPRGTLGIVPQKNVLFPELSCLQTLRVWKAVKWSNTTDPEEDLEQLLRDCDLGKKIHANANTLSGGQKRKLQLAIGLLGGSKIVLVDECTSGVDPLSRRALWRTLTSFRDERAIVFTTHFLDEADLLADQIAILAAPGKLVASGSPVSLKRDLGEGYSIQVTFGHGDQEKADSAAFGELLSAFRNVAPDTHTSSPAPNQVAYHLKSKDPKVVQELLELLDRDGAAYQVTSYDILGTTIEDIFLELMVKNNIAVSGEPMTEKEIEELAPSKGTLAPGTEVDSRGLNLANGRPVSPFRQAFTIFHKRILIAKRSWLTPLLTIGIAVAGACIPLVFLKGKSQSCTRQLRPVTRIPLYLPSSPVLPFQLDNFSSVLVSPPGILSTLGPSSGFLRAWDMADQSAFVSEIEQNYRQLALGGISIDTNTNEALFAWEASPPGVTGANMLNLVSNIMYNRALNATGRGGRTPVLIRASWAPFPARAAGTLVSLRWIVFFGALMAVYPAFYALYVSRERRSSVQAMQMSNGLSDPIGLWLGHLMFDTITVVILSTIIVIVFAAASGANFNGLGLLWFIMFLYGIAAALFAYCASLAVASPLAAFATVAGYQFVIFILYLSSYLLVLTYGKTSEGNKLISIIHWSTAWIAPVNSVTRAALVSVNLFSLLCDDGQEVTSSGLGTIERYGGPIVYLIVTIIVLLVVLVWADSGSRTARRLKDLHQLKKKDGSRGNSKEDVLAAAEEASRSDDLLRVLDVSKTYGSNKVVDDVSFSLGRDTVLALLGPNGAGKTTTFNMIRGDVIPDMGDVVINGTSVVRSPKTARASLGVCPQFTAIDSQLTVREHLIIYGKLKGLSAGPELNENIESILKATALVTYADRLASKLSGGNQRKLSLAIALIGNPAVILIDEFSTGIDPKMKRDMWQTLRTVAVGKAVIITTHSMEEASALANKVGILARRLLAVGTIESLAARYASYEVHFTCRTRDEVVRAQQLMSRIPGAKMADDVATRFEVPIDASEGFSLARLFNTLSSDGSFTEYTVEKGSLESVFLKVIRENDVKEEDVGGEKRRCTC